MATLRIDGKRVLMAQTYETESGETRLVAWMASDADGAGIDEGGDGALDDLKTFHGDWPIEFHKDTGAPYVGERED